MPGVEQILCYILLQYVKTRCQRVAVSWCLHFVFIIVLTPLSKLRAQEGSQVVVTVGHDFVYKLVHDFVYKLVNSNVS